MHIDRRLLKYTSDEAQKIVVSGVASNLAVSSAVGLTFGLELGVEQDDSLIMDFALGLALGIVPFAMGLAMGWAVVLAVGMWAASAAGSLSRFCCWGLSRLWCRPWGLENRTTRDCLGGHNATERKHSHAMNDLMNEYLCGTLQVLMSVPHRPLIVSKLVQSLGRFWGAIHTIQYNTIHTTLLGQINHFHSPNCL